MTDDLHMVHRVQELSRDLARVNTLHELYKRSVQGLLDLGFDRASLYLYTPELHEMHGTWGTDETGRLVDESHYMAFVGANREFIRRALDAPDQLHVWENKVLTREEEAVGFGWNALVVLQGGDRPFGLIFVDNLIRHKPLSELQREVLPLYGRTVGTLIVSRQFSALTEKYRTQNALKDRLFTILAHDLRGPIGNLAVMLGFACDQPMDPSDLHDVLMESRQAAQRTYNLLENMLGWVRGQIEEVAALRERLPVRRPLTAVQIWLESTAKAKEVHLIVECPENLSVVADERMVETIVRNLVSNAVKYSPRGASVRLRGRPEGGWVYVEVVDQGVGMPPEKVATLFVDQQKKSQPGTNGEGGSGLGLMFSTDLARTLGGRIEVESTPGTGSTFRLALPDELDGEL